MLGNPLPRLRWELSAATQGRAFCFQAPDPLSLSGRGAGSSFRLCVDTAQGSVGSHRFHWRTFTDKFSRAGEIVEIMRGTLPLAAHTGCTHLLHSSSPNPLRTMQRPGPQQPGDVEQTGSPPPETSSCPSTRGDAIGHPMCSEHCVIHRRLSNA
jgi:hypothetical protein